MNFDDETEEFYVISDEEMRRMYAELAPRLRDACDREIVTFSTATVRSSIRVPWRLRLRVWWQRRRETPEQRELREYVDKKIDHAILFGEEAHVIPCCSCHGCPVCPDGVDPRA